VTDGRPSATPYIDSERCACLEQREGATSQQLAKVISSGRERGMDVRHRLTKTFRLIFTDRIDKSALPASFKVACYRCACPGL
jgi:hypothetical protein